MPWFTSQVNTAAALANGSAIASIVPAAAANFHITQIILGMNNAGAAITDFAIDVGLNRATARGTATTTLTGNRTDPNSAASAITGMDTAWSVQPTLAAVDGWSFPYNTRGGIALNFQPWEILSTVGTANPLVFVNRSGAALPANHSITISVEWLE